MPYYSRPATYPKPLGHLQNTEVRPAGEYEPGTSEVDGSQQNRKQMRRFYHDQNAFVKSAEAVALLVGSAST